MYGTLHSAGLCLQCYYHACVYLHVCIITVCVCVCACMQIWIHILFKSTIFKQAHGDQNIQYEKYVD